MTLVALGLPVDTPGRGIVAASSATSALFAVVCVWDAVGVVGGEVAAVVMSLLWFGIALVVWIMGFARAVVRSTRGDEIAVASLFFLQGSAPRAIRIRLLGIAGGVLLLSIVTLATNPLGFLVNMLPIGFAGFWGARHGTFPERTDPRYTGRTDGRYRQRTNQGRSSG
jgi:hypothetical protein